MADKLTAVQHGGGWITNIGNAFFDLGSMWAVEHAVEDDVQFNLSSSFSRWTTSKLKRGPISFLGSNASATNVFDTGSNYDADYLVRAGACLSKRWFDLHGDVLKQASRNGTELIFHGIGFSDWSYESNEIEQVQAWMEDIEPYAIITRDEPTYEALEGIAEHSYNGIDCGFFLNDLHDPMPMREEHVAVNFDKKEEPDEHFFAGPSETVVRPHHSFWYPWDMMEYPKMMRQYYDRENVFVSDVPEEYIDVYASASETHADRVHACVATLMFGSPARLYIDTPRSYLLDRVDHGSVTERMTEPDLEIIEREKDAQLDFLSEIL